MRITAGLGRAEQYPLYAQAGADEVFCGFVPWEWTQKYGLTYPLNRREARHCPVQTGGENELNILADMQRDLRVPVWLTFNSPVYAPESYPDLLRVMALCVRRGFHRFIVADPGLMYALHRSELAGETDLCVSGESGEMNRFAVREWRELGAKRVIFHRQVPTQSMAALIRDDRAAHPDAPLEFEAFMMNEKCHFTGAFCMGLHCDELAHPCHVPWRLAPVDTRYDPSGFASAPPRAFEPGLPGSSGCGICALPAIEDAGVSVLKVVGRGADTQDMLKDISVLRKALDLLRTTRDPEKIKAACFPSGCGGECYYMDDLPHQT